MILKYVHEPSDKLKAIREQLRGKDRGAALEKIASLTVDEKKALLPEWINLARASHSPFQQAWKVIDELPREWVLKNIEAEVDSILEGEEETDYWMFLQLYARLDKLLLKKLAERASHHSVAEIRELGQEFLAKL